MVNTLHGLGEASPELIRKRQSYLEWLRRYEMFEALSNNNIACRIIQIMWQEMDYARTFRSFTNAMKARESINLIIEEKGGEIIG